MGELFSMILMSIVVALLYKLLAYGMFMGNFSKTYCIIFYLIATIVYLTNGLESDVILLLLLTPISSSIMDLLIFDKINKKIKSLKK